MADACYFDYAASAPLDPEVMEMMAATSRMTGNPSSIHSFGRSLRRQVDAARRAVASFCGGEDTEVIFTSGATEANNLAMAGLYELAAGSGAPGRILVSPFEHASVGAAIRRLADGRGAAVDVLPVGRGGCVAATGVESAVRPDTVLVAVMFVNNVLGTIQPVEEIGRIVAAERARRGPAGLPIYFHCDAVQAAGRLPLDVKKMGCDSLALSAHKICGPKGVGALWLRRGLAVKPLMVGGGQESGRRSGTENAAGIAGFGFAAQRAQAALTSEPARLAHLRQRLLNGIGSSGLHVLTSIENSVPNIVFIQSDRLDGGTLALKLDAAGVAVSSGSACDSGSHQPSSAVRAVFGEQAAKRGGIRVSFGRFTTEADIDRIVEALT